MLWIKIRFEPAKYGKHKTASDVIPEYAKRWTLQIYNEFNFNIFY